MCFLVEFLEVDREGPVEPQRRTSIARLEFHDSLADEEKAGRTNRAAELGFGDLLRCRLCGRRCGLVATARPNQPER